jgi:hypothetical protein
VFDLIFVVPIATVCAVGLVLYLLILRWARNAIEKLAKQNSESLVVVDEKRCGERTIARFRMNEAQKLHTDAGEYLRKHFLVQAISTARLGYLRSVDALHWANTDPKRKLPKINAKGRGRRHAVVVHDS